MAIFSWGVTRILFPLRLTSQPVASSLSNSRRTLIASTSTRRCPASNWDEMSRAGVKFDWNWLYHPKAEVLGCFLYTQFPYKQAVPAATKSNLGGRSGLSRGRIRCTTEVQALLDLSGHERDRRSFGSKRNLRDAHIIRNAGGIVTDDSLRSLLVSHYLLDTEEFMVINHTDCGLMHTTEQDLRTRIQNRTGTAAIAPAFFFAFQNIEENVRIQLQKLRTHPWIPKEISVRGFVYDVSSGRLREIE